VAFTSTCKNPRRMSAGSKTEWKQTDGRAYLCTRCGLFPNCIGQSYLLTRQASMRRAGVRPSVRMSVRLSSHAAYRLSIDICRRQRAAAASVLDCDPTDKDRQTCLARPAAESKSAGRGLYVLLLFFLNFIFF